MADLRIVDAPEIPTENITGEEKLPTGGSGNYSISLDSLADYTKTKKDLAGNSSVDSKVGGVRQELNTHIEDLLNPHQVTKGQIGLGNVDNTADADKPVSNSTQAAIISAVATKADKTYVDGQLTFKANKADVYTKQESSDLVNNRISTALTPVNTSLDLAKRGVANRYNSSLTYNSGERVVLANGDIVKSTIDGNTNDPNIDMTGWVNTKYEVSFFVDTRKFGLVSNETIDQADRIVAINNYVNSIPINKGIPVIVRTPTGYFKSSQGFEFDRPAILKANQDSMFDYIGTGTAIRLGKSNIPSIANTEFSYGVDGVLLTGATNSKYGIYISQYIVEPTLRNMRFVDFGNPNDVESWAVFCQADNWDIYIKDCKAFWLAKNNVNFFKVNGTRLDGSSDFGNSRLNVVDTIVQNMYTRSGGIAFFVNAFKTRFEGVAFQGAKTCVQLGEHAQVVEFSGGYCEAIYDNCENFIKVGEDGYLSVKEISNLSITGVYANLHNTNNPYGNTDTKFLVAAENVKLLNLNLSNIRTINSIKYPLLNLNNISGQTYYLSEVQHDNPLLHNINDDNIQCLSFSKNLLRNGDLYIWQRGSEFNHTGGMTKLADGYALLSDSTNAINVYKNPINGINNFPKLSNSLLNVVSIGPGGTFRTLRIRLGELKNFSNKPLSLSFYVMSDVDFMSNVTYVQKKGGTYTYKSIGEVDIKSSTFGKKYAVAEVSLDAEYDVVSTDTAYIDISLPLTVFNMSFSAFYLQNSLLNYGFDFGCFIDNLNFYRSFYQASEFSYFGSGIKNYQIELRPIMLKTPKVITRVVYADVAVNYNAAIPASSNSKFVFSLNNQANDVALNWTADCDDY